VVGAVVPASLVALAALPAVGLRSRLPEPMASHWGLTGSANGYMSMSAFLAWVLVLSVVPAAIAVTVSRRSPTAPGQIVPWLSGATFVLALTALLAPMMVAANLDAGDWRQANLTVGAPWVAAIGACAITAFCARLARRPETAVPTTKAEQLPSAGLRT